jgi:hypothetical protein
MCEVGYMTSQIAATIIATGQYWRNSRQAPNTMSQNVPPSIALQSHAFELVDAENLFGLRAILRSVPCTLQCCRRSAFDQHVDPAGDQVAEHTRPAAGGLSQASTFGPPILPAFDHAWTNRTGSCLVTVAAFQAARLRALRCRFAPAHFACFSPQSASGPSASFSEAPARSGSIPYLSNSK